MKYSASIKMLQLLADKQKTFKLKEIDWTITLPADFTLVNSLTDAENIKKEVKCYKMLVV